PALAACPARGGAAAPSLFRFPEVMRVESASSAFRASRPAILLDRREQRVDVFGRQRSNRARAAEKLLRQRTLALLELEHPLLDGAPRDQPVDEARPMLPDAVRAILGLPLDGRIPPGAVGNHLIRGRPRGPRPARL